VEDGRLSRLDTKHSAISGGKYCDTAMGKSIVTPITLKAIEIINKNPEVFSHHKKIGLVPKETNKRLQNCN